ncbi:MAG: metallophosphoesterase, partial [Gemmatimonadetes bacterium]|nr:metallophosphoesterase [Gemmatimonadota bacterium]
EPGLLEVVTGGAAPARFTTVSGQAHRVAVRRPRRDDVLLRYGAVAGAVHETRVSLATPARPPVEVRGVDSLYVVGDTHGDFDALLTGLRRAGLVDDAGGWTGGHRHLVFAGDLTDRGPDVLKLLWFVYRLEQDAARAGGRVHVVLGNHETMVIMGDLRYVHVKEATIAELHGVPYDALMDIRHTVLGRWLAAKPGAIRVDRALIAHGGVAPELAELTLRGIDRLLARYMAEDAFYQRAPAAAAGRDSLAYQARQNFFTHPRSLFWHRDYVQSDTAGAELQDVLRRTRSDVHVVGHTAVPFIQARYDDRLIAAHTPRFGAELLLLVRERNGLRRFRIVDDGPPQQF